MEYSEYRARAQRSWSRLGELGEYGRVAEAGVEYPLLRLVVPGDPLLIITSGFHGEEQAGPLTLLERMGEVVEYARERGVGLRVYPCINPSGFEAGTRYNRSGEKPNNDFLRYEVTPGTLKGELMPGDTFQRWQMLDGGPKETRALRDELHRLPAPAAALDIHQDRYMTGQRVYAYTFGPKHAYRPLMRTSAQWARVAASCIVDEAVRLATDADGLIEYHDGSITDYYMRRGVPHVAALETTVDTPLPACHDINLTWLRGFIDLAAQPQLEARAS